MSSFRLPVMKKAAGAASSKSPPRGHVRDENGGRFRNAPKPHGSRRDVILVDGDEQQQTQTQQQQMHLPLVPVEMNDCAVCLEPYAISEGHEDEHEGMRVEETDGALGGGGGGGGAFKLPYLLHCGHSFCAECLEHCAEAERSKSRGGFFSSSSSTSSSSSPSGRSRLFGSLLPAFASSASPTSPSSPPRLKVSVTCPVCRYRTPYDSARGPVGGLPKNYELITAIRVIRSLVTAAASSPPRQQQQQQSGKRKRKRTARRLINDCGEKEEKRNKQKKKKKAKSSAGLTKSVDTKAWKTLVITATDQPAQAASDATAMAIERSSVPVDDAVGQGGASFEGEEDTLPTAPPAHLFGDDDDIHIQDGDGGNGGRAEARQSFGLATAPSSSSAALEPDDPMSPPPSAPPMPFPLHLFHYTSSSPSFASSSSSSSSASASASSSPSTPALFSPTAPPMWAFPAFLSLPTPARTSAAATDSDASAAPSDAQAAVTGQANRWVDSSASCMRCQVSFGLFTRHRRCQYCGGIFCYRCCWQFCEMPVSFGYKRKQRSCIGCAQHLKSTQLRSPSPPPTAAPSSQAGSPFAWSSSSSSTAVVDELHSSASPSEEEEQGEEWPSFELKDKLAAVYDISCKAVDVGVEAVALAKGEASVEESAFVPSESTMLWGRCMGVMVALPLFVLGTSSLLMAAGGYHAWSFLARQRRKWHQEKQIEEEEARITEARLCRRRQPPQQPRDDHHPAAVAESEEDLQPPSAPRDI